MTIGVAFPAFLDFPYCGHAERERGKKLNKEILLL